MLILLLFNFTIPAEFPYNAYYEYLQVRGFTEQNFVLPNTFALMTEEFNNLLIADWQWRPVDHHIIGYFGKLITKTGNFSGLLGVNAHYEIDDNYGAMIDLRTRGKLSNTVSFSQALRISRTDPIDSAGPYPWKDLQAYIGESRMIFNSGIVDWEIGRRNLNLSWFDENSLMLSSAPEGYDGIFMAINGGFYEFHSFFGVLDIVNNKYITLHRLALKFRHDINIGFSEALLFSGNFEPLYLNPFVPYYLAQWGIRRDDNIMWLIDARIRFFKSLISGELLIDDYMYENDPYPDKLAYRLQIKSFPVYPVMVKAVYTMVDKWVYTQRYPQNVYENKGLPLGFPLGNDVDQISISVKYFTDRGLHPSLNADIVRKGEGSIYLPYEEEGSDWQPPFPSGVVEQQLKLFAGIDIVLLRAFYLQSKIGYHWIKNADHQIGNNSGDVLFNAKIWTFL